MTTARRVDRLIGVYNADGGLRGELRYALRRAAGRGHCALCDITHGVVRERKAWRRTQQDLGVPTELVHLNERTPELRTACDVAPCVLAEADGMLVVLLGPDDLAACRGDPDALEASVRKAAASLGLTWPAVSGGHAP